MPSTSTTRVQFSAALLDFKSQGCSFGSEKRPVLNQKTKADTNKEEQMLGSSVESRVSSSF